MQTTEETETIFSKDRLKSVGWLLLVGLVILVADQLTKLWVLNNMNEYDVLTPFPTFGRLFRFTYITNTGAAFGLFPGGGNIFMVVAIIVVIAIIIYIANHPTLPGIVRFAFGLQLGGAIGNMLDRIQHGSVVDFVDIGFWPIFNIADISIISGVILLAYWLWEEEERNAQLALEIDN